MFTKDQQTYITATLERMKAEIVKDMADGRVPAYINNFGDLHDHVDANEYGGMCEESSIDKRGLDLLRELFPDPEGAPDYGTMNSQRGMDIANSLQEQVSDWLCEGQHFARLPCFPGFEHEGMQITNPTAESGGGRWVVSPEEYGFKIMSTGGGCTAWVKDIAEGYTVMVTDINGASHEFGEDDNSVTVGLHVTDDTEQLGCWTMGLGIVPDEDNPPNNDMLRDDIRRFLLDVCTPAEAAAWIAALPPEVLDCEAESGVGEPSMELITAAQSLLHMMADLRAAEREAVIAAVAHQCRVFYFG